MDDRHRTITPAPIPLDQPATVRDAIDLDSQHERECSEERRRECQRRDEERASKDGVFWARIVALEAVVTKITGLVEGMLANARTNLKIKIAVATVAVALLGAATTVGIFVAKYAIVGAITIELDKRLPSTRAPGSELETQKPAKSASLWTPIRTAQASEPDR
jgi:hypothetical protein